jgi:hypothetical protein
MAGETKINELVFSIEGPLRVRSRGGWFPERPKKHVSGS